MVKQQDDRKISICIPTYNRIEMTIESFRQVHDDERVQSILIVDDCSEWPHYERLFEVCEPFHKVKLKQNSENQDCYNNKFIALTNSPTDWAILFDSDNILDKSYLDAIYSREWEQGTFYLPSWAMPTFDYRAFEGLLITKENVNEHFDKPMFSTMLNTANFFVNKKDYFDAFDPFVNPHTADSIYINYRHLSEGGSLFVVPNLHYKHTIHDGSHYKNNNHLTGNFYQEVENKIKALK
jgi:glycosyltransferase involved in cell wall biosynthesis